jgi:hypothetical protein
MAGLFDVDKEVARLGKQRAKLEKELAGVSSRLSNAKFLERASEAEVAKVGRRLRPGLGCRRCAVACCIALRCGPSSLQRPRAQRPAHSRPVLCLPWHRLQQRRRALGQLPGRRPLSCASWCRHPQVRSQASEVQEQLSLVEEKVVQMEALR